MKRSTSFLLLLFTSVLLMVVALYNGFPLVESDTGAYIEKGILNIIPADRSPFYGWFVRYTSMWASLWYTSLAQCMLLAFLLLRYITCVYGSRPAVQVIIVAVVCIVALTCVAWVSAYLMPDIFAAILLLSVLLYLAGDTSKWMQVLYCVIVFAATIIHGSHFPILLIFSVGLIALSLLKKQYPVVKRSIVLLVLSVMSWVLICSINAGNGYGFVYSRGGHVFMVTKFAETGILSKYLDENCPSKELKLCKHKDEIPDYSWEFMWSDDSPLYKAGGWDSSKNEFDIIIHDVLTTPHYLKLYAKSAAVGTIRQLVQVQAPDHTTSQGRWSSPYQRIATFFDDELNEYALAKHCSGDISASSVNNIYLLFFLVTSFPIVLQWRHLLPQTQFLYFCIILFFVANAFVTSLGSTVIYRFQYRIFWVLPATNFILLLRYFFDRNTFHCDTRRQE